MAAWFDHLRRDVAAGARHFSKNPAFTAVAVLSLALGIMSTTAIYSVVHAVILDPFPYKDVDNLMSVRVWDPGGRGGRSNYTIDQLLDIAERNTIFEGVIASTWSDVLWTGEGDPQRLRGNHGTMNTFDVMGVPPLLGRTTAAEDALPGAAPVVVLGYRFWQRQFAGDAAVLGRHLILNGVDRTVIGVMPKRFMWRGADVYLPHVFRRGTIEENVRSVHLLGRLKQGVSAAQAEADLRPIIEDLKQREPAQFPDRWRVGVVPFKETFPSSIQRDIWILFGAVALLLLIACANVSNLLLSKATARQKEIAVRTALGASRGRVVRQLLTESLLLALVGCAIGVALAYGGLRVILTLVPPNTIPDEAEIAINLPVLVFTAAVSALTAVVFGLAPALHASRRDVANPLRESGRGLSGGGVRQVLMRNSLVVIEVALSLVLLVGASLMIRTVIALKAVNPGFRPDRLLTMRVPLGQVRYPDAQRRVLFFEELAGRVASIPGVSAVGLNTNIHPMGNIGVPIEIQGSSEQNTRPVLIHQVNAGYSAALGMSATAGRLFEPADIRDRRQVALVNQSFVKLRLEGRGAPGVRFRIPRLQQPPFGIADPSFEIVGVVTDTMNDELNEEIVPEVYIPFSFTGMSERLAVLAAVDPANVTRSVVQQVYAIDRDQPVMEVRTLEAVMQDNVFAGPRFNLVLFGVFAALGLILAIVGVYGVVSTGVAQQTHELGVRIALGARTGRIAAMVMSRGARLLLTGIAVGLIASVFAARVMATQIWKVSTFDPVSFGSVSVLLLVAGLQACYWPARRAARVDPIVALRQE
jgi:putative ABC transport system permease protein